MNLNQIINDEKYLLTKRYFNMQSEAELIYGTNTVILIEVGTFYEVYQSDKIGKALEISQELNIVLTRKNKSIKEITEKNPYLCGIPAVSLDKHMEKLTESNKWTIILVNQVGEAPNITRKISKIVSPGTNIDYLKNDNYNYIASIFIEETNEGILYGGLSMIDITTGKVISFENYGTKNDKLLAIDEIVNIIKINNCSELVLTFVNVKNELDIINQVTNNEEISYIIKSKKDITKNIKINYQNILLKTVFELNSFLTPIEELDMERLPNALNALTILIEFISDHNYKVIKSLKRPLFINNSSFLYLGNNALSQLNITGDKNSSLIPIVNKGCSAIGKRFITDQLLNPMINKLEILDRYKLSDYFMDSKLRNEIRAFLKEIYDIERLWRKIEINTIMPFELFNFHLSINKVIEIYKKTEKFEPLLRKLKIDRSLIERLINFQSSIEDTFIMDKLSKFSFSNINDSFIKIDKIDSLANISKMIKENYALINIIAKEISFLITNKERNNKLDINPRESNFEGVNVGFNETEGFYFEITKNKILTMEKNGVNVKETLLSIAGEFTIKTLKNSQKIYFKACNQYTDQILSLESRLILLNKKYFIEFIDNLKLEDFDKIAHFISYVEFLINNAILKDTLNYNKPEIVDIAENSFIEAVDLRHAVIEQIQDNEVYIPNDIALGNKNLIENKDKFAEILQDKENVNGLLLYGINSSGKSSTMKSLGIAIILAQAGFYVPAEQFRYSIFENLFTRITGSDNLHKGLSTFAIEMLEMKNIFNRSNGKTLVLGDEIAHGTETVSALSIVASAIKVLAERNVFFIFATHLHKLKDIPAINGLNTVVNVHLEVKYDEISKLLIFNRKLKSGQGSSIYGLEFAKYMQMDKEFLSLAYEIRRDIAEDNNSIENITRVKKSRYNKNTIVSTCEICGETATEEHHIKEQQLADNNGMINHVHKNHRSNLVNLCNKCHLLVHKNKIFIEGFKATSNGRKLIFNKS